MSQSIRWCDAAKCQSWHRLQDRQHPHMKYLSLQTMFNVILYACNQDMQLHTHTRLTALFPRLLGWAGTRKVKPIWIILKHETVSGSGISWAICKSAPRSRQITTPASHHSVFYRPDGLPAVQPTASKHWRDAVTRRIKEMPCQLPGRLFLSPPYWSSSLYRLPEE